MFDRDYLIKKLYDLKKIFEFKDDLAAISNKYYCGAIWDIPTAEDIAIDTLNKIYELVEHDGYTDIDYFVYELDFGKSWEPGMITDIDGSDVDMSSIEKFVDYLEKEGEWNSMYVDINEIVIPDWFKESTPSQKKYDEKLKTYLDSDKRYYKAPIVDKKNVLKDGYVTYLVLKDQGAQNIWVKSPKDNEEPKTYVFGKHLNSNDTKEYVWRLSNSVANRIGNITEGMTLMVVAGKDNKIAPIIVTKLEKLNTPPVTTKIKKVVGKPKEIKRELQSDQTQTTLS